MTAVPLYPNDQGLTSGAIPVRLVSSNGSAFYNATGGTPVGGITPAAGSAVAVATGGTAVTVVTGPCTGGYITNPTTATSQGVGAAENMYIDMVATPGSTDAAANGTTVSIAPGQSFTIPALGTGVLLKANAATTGHKFTAVVW